MLLSNYLDHYALENDVTASTVQQYRWAVNSLGLHIGRPPTLADLTDATVNGWIAARVDKVSRWTARSQRGAILALWRDAAEAGVVPGPGKIRPVKCAELDPRAFLLSEIAKLIDCTGHASFDRQLPNGVHQGKLTAAVILVAYDSGLRKGDLWRIRRDQITDGTLCVVAAKSGRVKVCRLRERTTAAIDALHPRQTLALPWCLCATQWLIWWRRLCDVAGLPHFRAGLQQIRRSSASHLERECPGSASRHLGHSSPELARKHYLDRRIAFPEAPLPPEIG